MFGRDAPKRVEIVDVQGFGRIVADARDALIESLTDRDSRIMANPDSS